MAAKRLLSSALLVGAVLLGVSTPAAAQLLLRDIVPGAAGSFPLRYTSFRGACYFLAQNQSTFPAIYRTDGSAAGTVAITGYNVLSPLVTLGRRILFIGSGAFTAELFETDGTRVGTRAIAPLNINGQRVFAARNFVRVGDVAYGLVETDARVYALLRTDGTAAGTRIVRAFSQQVAFRPIRMVGSRIVFSLGTSGGFDVWSSDGTASGTVRILRLTGTAPSMTAGVVVGGTLFFRDTNYRIWASDGTARGTALVGGLPQSYHETAAFGGSLFVVTGIPGTSIDLYRVDVATRQATRITSLWINQRAVDLVALTSAGDRLYIYMFVPGYNFTAWRSDGTAAGTVQFLSPADGIGLANGVAIGNQMFFTGQTTTNGREPWITDGTRAGTRMLYDLNVGPLDSWPRDWTVLPELRVGPSVVFTAVDRSHGPEPRIQPMASVGAATVVPVRRGCVSGGAAPELAATGGQPSLGTARFALELRTVRPNTLAAFFFDVRVGAEVGGCASLFPAALMDLGRTGASGNRRLPIPVPNDATLVGRVVLAHGLVANPGGPMLGVADATGIQALVLGR